MGKTLQKILAAVMISSNVASADANMTAMYLELDAIMACVLGGNSMQGGRFSLIGSLIGALIVRTLTITLYMKGVPSESILMFKALVIMLVGIVQTLNHRKFNKKPLKMEEKAA